LFLSYRQLICLERKCLGQPLIDKRGYADIFFADEFFKFVGR
jgi:hypothetical protein